MKFVAAKCPNCGAKIKVDINKKLYHCDYCRSDIILDDGRGLNNNVDPSHYLNVNDLLKHHKNITKFMFIPIIIFIIIFGFVFISIFSKVSDFDSNVEDVYNESEISSFNFFIDEVGVINSVRVETLLNHVVNTLNDSDRTITVVYNEKVYISLDEIMNLIVIISNMDDDYMVKNEKDEAGYINKIIIDSVN